MQKQIPITFLFNLHSETKTKTKIAPNQPDEP